MNVVLLTEMDISSTSSNDLSCEEKAIAHRNNVNRNFDGAHSAHVLRTLYFCYNGHIKPTLLCYVEIHPY